MILSLLVQDCSAVRYLYTSLSSTGDKQRAEPLASISSQPCAVPHAAPESGWRDRYQQPNEFWWLLHLFPAAPQGQAARGVSWRWTELLLQQQCDSRMARMVKWQLWPLSSDKPVHRHLNLSHQHNPPVNSTNSLKAAQVVFKLN